MKIGAVFFRMINYELAVSTKDGMSEQKKRRIEIILSNNLFEIIHFLLYTETLN